METFRPGNYNLVKRTDLRINSAVASMRYGPLCKVRALPLHLARLYAGHLWDADKPKFEHEMPLYSRMKAILVQGQLQAIPLEEIGGNFFIRMEKKGIIELIQLHNKFRTPEYLDKESQLILMSEGWETAEIGRNTFMTKLCDGNDAESHPVPRGKEAGQNDNYYIIDVNASDYPFLFGDNAEGVVRTGLPKGAVIGGLAAAGCGTCLNGIIIPKFEWHCSVPTYA